MSSTLNRRVTLVLDRWEISPLQGERVTDFSSEKDAFRKIEVALRRDSVLETVANLTFIVDPSCWEHFRSYRAMAGVQLREITPLGELKKLCKAEPPPWLSNDQVWRWGLLHRTQPAECNPAAWEATIAAWLIPGLDSTTSLLDWFHCLGRVKDFPAPFKCEPVTAWIAAQFAAFATKTIASRDIVDEFLSALNSASSPVDFALEWIERTALLPLLDPNIDNPLRSSGLIKSTARQRVLARNLPLVFPVPYQLGSRVAEAFVAAVRQARLRDATLLAKAAIQINAWWPGIAEELNTWLDVTPQGITTQVAAHLSKLREVDGGTAAVQIVNDFSPPDPVPAWRALDDGFGRWVVSYAKWLRRMFLRRELPNESDDPAAGFARWMKDNVEVCFNHPERSYLRIGQTIHEALRNNRHVVLVLVDALACQLSNDLAAEISGKIGHPPSTSGFLFGPIPTVSEVAKAAVVTGTFPDAGHSVSIESISQAYGLAPSAVLLAANWSDAERAQVDAATKLVVYRDNRVDDQLSYASTFKALLQDVNAIFPRLARLVTRWVNDLRSLNGSAPLLIVTADHGFTFGPPPGQMTNANRKLDGAHRCAVVQSSTEADDTADPTVTVLNAKRLHLRNDYIAARGRYFGKGTITGWKLSHGGLLPEEVFIPQLEWFGLEAPLEWPTVTFPDGVRRDKGRWLAIISLVNDSQRALDVGSIHFRVVGHDIRASKDIPRLPVGGRFDFEIELAGPEFEGSKDLPIDVLLRQRSATVELDRCYRVVKQRQLVERTEQQDEFESMF